MGTFLTVLRIALPIWMRQVMQLQRVKPPADFERMMRENHDDFERRLKERRRREQGLDDR